MAQVCGFDVEHLHGPEGIFYARDELVVVCLVRDGLPWVRSFVEHYFNLGAKHLVFLDNGSTDGTVEALQRYENVTVLRTQAPFREHEDPMRRYLMERFGQGRWCLCVDIDELFDYPYSDVVGLHSFLGYLNSNSYTAVVAQMLDMFPEKLSSGREKVIDEPLKKLHRFYDVSDLSSQRIEKHHRCPPDNAYGSDEVRVFKGGVRRTIFGFNPILTKHALVFLDGKARPISPGTHWAGNVRAADVTCVLYHYKFLGEYLHEVSMRTVQGQRHRKNLGPYEKYLAVLEKTPDLQLKRETSREISSASDLLDEGFLTVSAAYVGWVGVEEERDLAQDVASEGPRDLAEAFLASRNLERLKAMRMSRLQQQLRAVRQHADDKDRALQKLREQVHRQDHKLQKERSGRRRLSQESENLKQQLEGLRGSRVWKLARVLHHIKARLGYSQGDPRS